MTLSDYLRVLREQKLVVLLAVFLGVVSAAAAFYTFPPRYTAQLTMYVSAQSVPDNNAQQAYQGSQLSQDKVASFTELLTAPRVLGDVINRLQLPETPDELARLIKATSKRDSVLLDVSATDRSPGRAAAIVNAVGGIFPLLVAELERPIDRPGTPAVAVRVVQPAAVPIKPSSPSLPVVLALGLLAGLAVGVGGALTRDTLDTSVKSPEQLRQATADDHNVEGAPILGTIAYDSQIPEHPLTLHEKPQSPWAEAFRQLRTNLQFVNIDSPPKVILVTSSMPGEGKTTTVANLAIAFGAADRRTLVIEGDLRRPNLVELLGLDNSAGLTSVLSSRASLDQVIQPWRNRSFDVLASGPLPPNPSELLSSKHMAQLLADLRERYDVILIDAPPLLPVTDAAAVAPATDGAILICRYKQTSRHQVTAATVALGAVSVPVLGTVFTMVPSSGPRAYAQYNAYYRAQQPARAPAHSNPVETNSQYPLPETGAPEATPARPSPTPGS
jgi:capsular exopolysaccharide synthesis family protein